VIGAASAYVGAYVWPLPFGATIPAFVLTFVVYLLISLVRRARTPRQPSRHLVEATLPRRNAAASAK
jgi:NCS1 family nucleobase:cation symporter-1